MKTAATSLMAVLVGIASSADTRADEPTAVPALAAPPSIVTDSPPASDQAWVECPRCHPEHWTVDPTRLFVALRADLGYLYCKPRFSFGYGKPFSVWGGLELVPLVTPDYTGGYSGIRFAADWLEIRAGARYVHAFTHQFLTPATSFNLVDLSEYTGHPSNYFDLDAELSGAIPAGPGAILLLATASSIQGVAAGYYVYDEALRVVVDPPAVFRERLGYSLPLLPERTLHVGVVGEVLEIPNRKAEVVRAGIVSTFDIDDHLQAIATVVAPVYSPDALGLLGADYTELGIRYRWATGHTHAPEERIPVSAHAEAMGSDQ